MAKILYGIAGEGMGHAVRSSVVIRHLLKKHEVVVVSSRRPYEFLKERFSDVYDIYGFNIAYRNNKVSNIGTFLSNTFKFPKGSYKSLRTFRNILKTFKPDIVISDFEPFTSLYSNFFKVPLISLDNMHVMTNCKVDVPKRFYKSYLTAKLIIKSIILRADYFLISSFFYPQIKKKNTFLFPPLIRDKILKIKAKQGRKILVYQTSKSNGRLRDVLKSIDEEFIIYGYNIEKKEDNLTFKNFSEEEFIKDLSSCKALVSNGGFTTISEAVFLGKPVLSIPIEKHFEQTLNGLYIEKEGFGKYVKRLTREDFLDFLSNISLYKRNLSKYRKEGNERILTKLDFLIDEIKS